MAWDPDSVTSEQLNKLRAAAEQAWGDDTRHEKFAGHPDPSAGQCYVTSRWLADRLGGDVAQKGGHFFWVSPNRSHVIDLTGDQFTRPPENPHIEGALADDEDEPWTFEQQHFNYRPRPVMYKRANHPPWRDFQVTASSGAHVMANR